MTTIYDSKDEALSVVVKGRVGALDRALQVLDCLQTVGTPRTPNEIARVTGAPVSTTYSIIEDLLERSVLERSEGGRVWLGKRLFTYGLSYANRLEYLDVSAEEAKILSGDVGETVQVCGRDGGELVVLQMAEGDGFFRVSSRIGARIPINWTASGRLLVGHFSAKDREAYFALHSRPSPTGRAETDARILSQSSARAWAEGFSIQIGETFSSVACIAAPVLNEIGECVITISIVLPESKAVEDMQGYIRAVKNAARRIEKRMGWSSEKDGPARVS
ncbi:IclR family transcriptional regulator [Pandoraea terrae]|uniref:IclR family transcriptional regulator n=1 Tax=Pandoraea terrae TaxID=1537710 RepID=A0A5E4Z9B5_9BURK|nr:IclR family transcriptional regulator [Pandoraea terrae]VVE57759.1 IclR family transcriptional regulator [Pandoraea terrae]